MKRIIAAACIWDMDHTLYHHPDADIPSFAAATLTALRTLGAPGVDVLTLAQLKSITDYEYRTNGSSYPYIERTYGIARAELEAETQNHLIPNDILPCSELPILFASCPRRHIINTHAAPRWAAQVLDHIGLTPFFPPQNIVYHANHGFASKSTSPSTHQAALALAGCDVADVVMIEDAEKNLRIPKEMGMKTVLVGHHSERNGSHIDMWVERAADVFSLLDLPPDFIVAPANKIAATRQ